MESRVVSAKRAREETTGDGVAQQPAKFSKPAAEKVVPTVVPIDFGADESASQPPQTPTQAVVQEVQGSKHGSAQGSERQVATRLDWRLINNREALNALLSLSKFTKKGASYVTVNVAEYARRTGIQVQLDQYNHLAIAGPKMMNIWGIGSRTYQGKTSHKINYSVSDSSQDVEVAEFAQFLALLDDVLLDKSVDRFLESDTIRIAVDWVADCTPDPSKGVDRDALRRKIGRFFHGALRCSDKHRIDKAYKPVTLDANDEATVPEAFWFQTKIQPNQACDRMCDITCITDDEKPSVFFYQEKPELMMERATYVTPLLVLPSVNFAQKEMWATWVSKRIKVATIKRRDNGGEAEYVDDFGDGPATHFSQAACDEVKRQEEEYRKRLENGEEFAAQTVVEDDNGGF